MRKFAVSVISFFLVCAFVAVLALILALPTMWLWNYAATAALAGAREIGFWQALCLNLLCGLLVRSGSASSSKS